MADNPFNIPFVDDKFPICSTGPLKERIIFLSQQKNESFVYELKSFIYFYLKWQISSQNKDCDKNIADKLCRKQTVWPKHETLKTQPKENFIYECQEHIRFVYTLAHNSHSKQLTWKEFQF